MYQRHAMLLSFTNNIQCGKEHTCEIILKCMVLPRISELHVFELMGFDVET
jgi:hypothetical protein